MYVIRPGRYLLYLIVKIYYFMISLKFDGTLRLSQWYNKTRSLCTKQTGCNLTALHTFYYEVPLITTTYSNYEVYFFLGQFLNICKWFYCYCLLLSIFLIVLYIFPVGQYNSVFDLLSMRALITTGAGRPSNIQTYTHHKQVCGTECFNADSPNSLPPWHQHDCMPLEMKGLTLTFLQVSIYCMPTRWGYSMMRKIHPRRQESGVTVRRENIYQ